MACGSMETAGTRLPSPRPHSRRSSTNSQREGMKDGADAVAEDLRALGRIERIMEPPEPMLGLEEGGKSEPYEVSLPEAFRDGHPRARGFRMGKLQIIFEPFDGPPYGRLSVSHPTRYPTFEELLRSSRAPGGPTPNLWVFVPRAGGRREAAEEHDRPLRHAAKGVARMSLNRVSTGDGVG